MRIYYSAALQWLSSNWLLFGAWGSHCGVIFSITNEDYAFR